jgi:dihydroorotase
MALPDVIERATARPARAMRRADIGTLQIGSAADVAIFHLEQGSFTFHDVHMAPRAGQQRLICDMTLVGGVELARTPERPPAIWAELPAHQRQPGHPAA